MEIKPVITLGPFFTPEHSSQPANTEIVPLSLAVEWANANTAIRIPLFRRPLRHAPDRIRLENVVFRRSDLPSDMECQEYQVIDTMEGRFLPLDALLAALYSTGEIARPIFSVLEELAAQVPFHNALRKPIAAQSLLSPEAETRGFRLNAVFHESGLIYAQVGWEPECQSTRFHVCAVSFRTSPGSRLEAVSWVAPREIGVCQMLSKELRRIVRGDPMGLFSESGIQLMENEVLQSSQSVAPKE